MLNTAAKREDIYNQDVLLIHQSPLTARDLTKALEMKNQFDIKIEKNTKNEIIGIKLSNSEIEYSIDKYSMPYVFDKTTNAGYGLSNEELSQLINDIYYLLDPEGRIFLNQNRKSIIQKNSVPQDVFLGNKFFGFGININGNVYWIQSSGDQKFFMISVKKDQLSDENVPLKTRKKVFNVLEQGFKNLTIQGQEYFTKNKQNIQSSLF